MTTGTATALIGVAMLSAWNEAGAFLDDRVILFPAMLGFAFLMAGSGHRANAAWAPPIVCLLSSVLLLVIARNAVPYRGVAAALVLLLVIISLAPAYRAWPDLTTSPVPRRTHLALCALFTILALGAAPLTQCHGDFAGAPHCHSFWVSAHIH